MKSTENLGIVQASINNRIPVELTIHLLYESKVQIESERDRKNYKKYIEACVPKHTSIFTPKYCHNIVQELKKGQILKDNILTTHNIDPETIDLWIRLFTNPKKPQNMTDPHPKTFKAQIVRDYLEGNYTKNDIKNNFGVTYELLENWVFQELEENEDGHVACTRKRLSKTEKQEIISKYTSKKITLKEIRMKYGVSQRELLG